jgi:hypothetical protein
LFAERLLIDLHVYGAGRRNSALIGTVGPIFYANRECFYNPLIITRQSPPLNTQFLASILYVGGVIRKKERKKHREILLFFG